MHALTALKPDGSKLRGSSAELLSGYLDEYLWRERYGRNGPTAFEKILSRIAEINSEDHENQPDL